MTAPSLLPNWPPAHGLNTIHVPKAAAKMTLASRIQIAAPPTTVFDILRNVSAYKEWNSLLPNGAITSQPHPHKSSDHHHHSSYDPTLLYLDTHFNLTITLSGQESTIPQIASDFSTPKQPSTYVSKDLLRDDGSWYQDLERVHRVAWMTNEAEYLGDQFHSERFNEVIDLKGGKGGQERRNDDGKGGGNGKDKGGDALVEYRTWELSSGPRVEALVAAGLQPVVQKGLDQLCVELKERSEMFAKGDGEAGRGGHTGDVVPGAPGFVGP